MKRKLHSAIPLLEMPPKTTSHSGVPSTWLWPSRLLQPGLQPCLPGTAHAAVTSSLSVPPLLMALCNGYTCSLSWIVSPHHISPTGTGPRAPCVSCLMLCDTAHCSSTLCITRAGTTRGWVLRAELSTPSLPWPAPIANGPPGHPPTQPKLAAPPQSLLVQCLTDIKSLLNCDLHSQL
jgi:hypothetical protein